jgi:hypothetical protein
MLKNAGGNFAVIYHEKKKANLKSSPQYYLQLISMDVSTRSLIEIRKSVKLAKKLIMKNPNKKQENQNETSERNCLFLFSFQFDYSSKIFVR